MAEKAFRIRMLDIFLSVNPMAREHDFDRLYKSMRDEVLLDNWRADLAAKRSESAISYTGML